MPWVNEEMCVGCGLCVNECPAEAISISDKAASIDDNECIRCGHCQEICPQEAVQPDGEKIPEVIATNVVLKNSAQQYCNRYYPDSIGMLWMWEKETERQKEIALACF